MRSIIRYLAASIEIETYHRLIVHSILKNAFIDMQYCPTYQTREELLVKKKGGSDRGLV